MSTDLAFPPDLEALLLGAVQDPAPPEPIEEATRRVRSRVGRAAVTREIAAVIETFDTPYASEVERYVVTIDDGAGEVIELGRPYRGSQCFPTQALKRNIGVYRDFMAFAATQDTADWRFWNVGIPNAKAPVHILGQELKRFNAVLNQELSELRKRKWIEVLLLGVHVRYDPPTGTFDLHAHLICRVPKSTHSLASSRLFRKFSKIEAKDGSIRNLEAAVTYLLWGIIDPEKLVTWPQPAIKAVWNLTAAKVRLMRTGGGFAKWRREKRERLKDPAAQKARRRKAENRAATAYEPAKLSSGDRVVARLSLTLDGCPREGVLIERARPPGAISPPAAAETRVPGERAYAEAVPLESTGYSPATVATSQESPEQPTGAPTPAEHPPTRRRRPQAWWWRAWPYGRGSTALPSTAPRPLHRRLAACSCSPRALRRVQALARRTQPDPSPS